MLPSSPWDPLSPSCRGGCSHTEDRSSFWFCFQFCSAACCWLVATGMRSQRAHGARDSLKPPIPMKVHPSPTSSDLCGILLSASVRAGWDCVVLLCSCPGWGEHPRTWPPAQLSAEETSSFRVSSAKLMITVLDGLRFCSTLLRPGLEGASCSSGVGIELHSKPLLCPRRENGALPSLCWPRHHAK